jgi:UDP-N-acetylmuramoyl-tripeptide--D-alanyl-D-alanine ligase
LSAPTRDGSVVAAPARRSLGFALSSTGGQHLPSQAGEDPAHTFFAGANTDSRAVRPGQLFVAIKGARVDGFEYCAQAVSLGAAVLMVPAARGRPPGCDDVPVLAVDDPVLALGRLASACRDEFAGRVVGVTGSNGKTTTKELIAAALSSVGPVLHTPGSFNTEVGLPLTVLSATGQEAFWVLEMGMRGLGEIAYLCRLARPHVGLVTNVFPVHIERLGSLSAVARAKGEMFSGLTDEGVAVLPAEVPLLEGEARHLPEPRKRRFAGVPGRRASLPGLARGTRVLDFVPMGAAGSRVRFDVGGAPYVLDLPLAGEHNAANAAAALSVILALGLPVGPAVRSMTKVSLPPHRSLPVPAGGRIVLDDCYNANPTSTRAALATVASSVGAAGGKAFAILGDMLELGPDEAELHRAVGAEVVRRGFAGLGAVGSLGRYVAEGARAAGLDAARICTTDDPVKVAAAIAAWTSPGDWILVKASRAARLERAVDALVQMLENNPPPSS